MTGGIPGEGDGKAAIANEQQMAAGRKDWTPSLVALQSLWWYHQPHS
jgi:hypothetical protein